MRSVRISSDISSFLNSPNEPCYQALLCVILSRLEPSYVVSDDGLLNALEEFLSRASNGELVKLLPETIIQNRMNASRRARMTAVSAVYHSPPPPRAPHIPMSTTRSDPYPTSMSGYASTHRSPVSVSSGSTDAPTLESNLSIAVIVPSTAVPTNGSLVTATPSASRESNESGQDQQPGYGTEKRLIRILKTLPETDDHISQEIKSDPERFWEDQRTVLKKSNHETDATERYRRLGTGEKENTKSSMIARCRERMLNILRGNEQEILLQLHSKKTGSFGESHINHLLCKILGVQSEKLKGLRTQWNKYICLMKDFGPGAILVLSGSHTDWLRLPNTQYPIFRGYVRRYRGDWVKLARSLNFPAAVGLIRGMLRVGMQIENLTGAQSTVLSIIMKYVKIGDGGISENVENSQEDPYLDVNASESDWLTGIEELHQILTRSVDSESDCPEHYSRPDGSDFPLISSPQRPVGPIPPGSSHPQKRKSDSTGRKEKKRPRQASTQSYQSSHIADFGLSGRTQDDPTPSLHLQIEDDDYDTPRDYLEAKSRVQNLEAGFLKGVFPHGSV